MIEFYCNDLGLEIIAMTKKNPKEMQTLLLNRLTCEVLRDVTDKDRPGLVKFDSMRTFVEQLINRFIFEALKDKFVHRSSVHAGMSHEEFCKIWLKWSRGMRSEAGDKRFADYKVYRRTEAEPKDIQGKIIYIFSPEDLPNEND